MTYRLSRAPKRPSKITVPERANPLAKVVFSEMRAPVVTWPARSRKKNAIEPKAAAA